MNENVLQGNEEPVVVMSEENIGNLIDHLTELRVEKAFYEKQAEEFAKRIAGVEELIIHAMANSNLETASHGGTKVTPKEHTYAHVEDWTKFYDFIHNEQYYHLLEKRVSVTGYRELLDLGREVPGVVPFKKLKLSVTKSAR